MQHRLYVILSRRQVAQTADRIAGGEFVHHDSLAGLQAVNVHAEDHLAAYGVVDLHSRFGRWVVLKKKKEATVERLFAAIPGKRNREAGAGRVREGRD